MAKTTKPTALAEALSRARALSAEMNSATDQLNRALYEAEKAIADLKLGVTASVNVVSDPESAWYEVLSFGKVNQTWRLMWETGYADSEDSPEVTPLVNASRATRLSAVDSLPALVEALIRTASEEVETVRAKAKAAQELTAQLKLPR